MEKRFYQNVCVHAGPDMELPRRGDSAQDTLRLPHQVALPTSRLSGILLSVHLGCFLCLNLAWFSNIGVTNIINVFL